MLRRFLLIFLCGLFTAYCGGEKSEEKAKIEKMGNLTFYRQVKPAMTQARAENKPVFIDFYAHWCVNCKLFNKLAVKKGALNTALQKATLLKVYDTDAVFKDFRAKPDFKELKIGLPLFVILNPDGSLRWKTTDYKDSAGMIRNLSK